MDHAIKLNDVVYIQDVINSQTSQDQDRLDLLTALPTPTDGENYEMDQITETIATRPKRLNDASNFLNYLLLHTTKGEPNLL
eukprot:4554175-Amphidinium_carterae.1